MKRCIVCFALGFLLAAATPAEAQNEWLSKAVSLQGQVEKRRGPETDWVPVRVGNAFGPGDSIKVHKNSRAGLLLQDNTVLRVDQNTTVTFLGEQESQHPLIDLFSGSLHFFTRTKRKLQIKTPFVNAAVEGTEFLMSVDAGQSSILALEGRVRASNPHGSVAVQAGELVVAEEGSAPVGSIALKPMDAVAWTLYYPPLWELGTGRELSARETRIFGRARSVPEALQALEQLEQTPRTRLLRSSLLLQVGRWNEALALVDDVLGQDPTNGLALSQRAIIHLVRGEREQAFETAQKADAAGKKSAVPAIALSYVHQARFELEEALLQTGNAVSREPKNALARARRAELLLASGRTAEALDMACGAVALNPELSQTHMVLGFASLSEFRTQEAAAAFEKAILLDQAEPLARLGLGLTMIRENRLEEGREQMEIAMEMDPGNSILRSYLGKSYFAENREEDALNQLDRAKVLDPRDPTPWLYEAFVLQSMNRPTEALLSIKESMERNNNRAVYRSSLLLDKDLASRSSSLAWIYNELGFEQLALKEGWQSVNEHPADFSAHRVLADSYSALPRHEISRVSELLQSQLLQPVTVNPVLPHLAESELFIFEDAGPMASGFNEFNALFQRDGIGLLASGVLGGDDTWGDEVVLSGIHGGLSYSLGQFHYETDGFRANNDLDQDIGNVFLQWAATAQTSIQADFRYRDVERGDLPLRFDRDLAQETLRQYEERRTFRMGLHHAFSPHSDVIGTVAVQDQEFKHSSFLE
ncbi:MAG: FecR domain-containing protein, partial [Desulfovibrionales bacterium]